MRLNIKKMLSKTLAGALAGALVFSTGMTVTWANNHTDTTATMTFDEVSGDYVDYTIGREKEDASSGYIRGIWADNDRTFLAALVGANANGGTTYYENFKLITYRVYPGQAYYMTNYVKESGYNYAAMKCESDYASQYTVEFAWSPDSI